MEYVGRLSQLNLPSLRYWRRRGHLIYTYRLFQDSSLFTQQISVTRGHDFKIYKPHAVCLPHRHFFAIRIVNDWNGLPYDLVNIQ